MKRITALLALLVLCNIAFSTCIVVVVSPDRVLLATDSKSRGINSVTGEQSETSTAKIYEIQNWHLAVSGYIENTITGYNAYKIFGKYLAKINVYDSIKMSKAVDSISFELRSELKYVKSNPVALDRQMKGDAVMVSFVLAGLNNGIPFAYIVSFGIKDIEKEEFEIQQKYIQSNYLTTVSTYALGESKELMEYVRSNSYGNLSPWNIHDYAKTLIQISITNHPDVVGPPIDILEIKNIGI